MATHHGVHMEAAPNTQGILCILLGQGDEPPGDQVPNIIPSHREVILSNHKEDDNNTLKTSKHHTLSGYPGVFGSFSLRYAPGVLPVDALKKWERLTSLENPV